MLKNILPRQFADDVFRLVKFHTQQVTDNILRFFVVTCHDILQHGDVNYTVVRITFLSPHVYRLLVRRTMLIALRVFDVCVCCVGLFR